MSQSKTIEIPVIGRTVMREDAITFAILRMFKRESADHILFYGDRAKLASQMREYEAGARCFMLQPPTSLLPKFKTERARVKRSLLEKLKQVFA